MSNENDVIDITGAREIMRPKYRIDYLDKLAETRRPFASKIYDNIYSLDTEDNMTIENILVDTVIALEELVGKYQSELWEYRQRFGDLPK